MELTYREYLAYVEKVLKEETIRELAGQVKTLGKFRESSEGQWEPVAYPGYTVITPTLADDRENIGFYGLLSDIGEELFWKILFPGIVWAPTIAQHMTIGRLISGDVFVSRILNSREEELLFSLNKLFTKVSNRGILGNSGTLRYEVKGLSIFPQGVIAAIVSPAAEDDYRRLQIFREYLYTDQVLMNLGVERKRSFHGHITLFYIEEELSEKDKSLLADAVIDINRRFFSMPLPFNIGRAEVRKFDNFTEFYRKDQWPVLIM